MRPLSATECISPAIERTRLVLFTPFRAGRSWKLCAVSYVSRYGTFFFPVSLFYLLGIPAVRRSGGTSGVLALGAGVLVFTALLVWIFYLSSRLGFVAFDVVLEREQFVRPAWRKYRSAARRFTWFKMAVGTMITMLAAVPIAAYVRQIMPLLYELRNIAPGQPPPPKFLGALFAGYGLFFLVFGTAYLLSSLLTDFVLPSLALEDTSLSEAFRRMVELVRQEPGEFALYTLLKVLLGVGGTIGAFVAWEIAVVICTLLVGIVVGLAGFGLHAAGVPLTVLIVVGVVLAFVWYLLVIVFGAFYLLGAVFTFLEAFAFYFLAGRYPRMAELLERTTPPPPPNPYLPGYAPYMPPPQG